MSKQIPIFQSEIQDGLEGIISKNSSINYLIAVQKPEKLIRQDVLISRAKISGIVKAALSDPDLYFYTSILCSTGWNKNDEIFLKGELFAARNSAIHKRTNLNHSELEVVGHMINSMAIDADGNIIDDDTKIENLPDEFHIITNNVLYSFWEDETRKKAVETLIGKIESGEMFVSMECIFFNFDYGIVTPEGKNVIVTRNEESAFLTKHLRIYGGTGEYNNHKIGRIPRDFIFSGKGFVEKPANPNSVIVSHQEVKSFIKNNENNSFYEDLGVLINCSGISKSMETNVMSQTNPETPVVDTKELDTLKAQFAEVQTAKESLVQELTAVKSELTATQDKNKALETELQAIKAEALKTNRVASLVSGGLTAEQAKAEVEKFIALNDEQFASVAEALIKAAKVVVPTESELAQAAKKTADELNKSLEEAQPEGANAGLAVQTTTVDQETEANRKSLAEQFSKVINRK